MSKKKNRNQYKESLYKPKINEEYIDHLCKLNDKDTSVPQDVDTKVALRDIEEQGVKAIGGVLNRATPDVPDENFTYAKGGNNTTSYDDIKWESKATRERIKEWKYCPICGNRLLKPRLKRGFKTCSKACTDIEEENK